MNQDPQAQPDNDAEVDAVAAAEDITAELVQLLEAAMLAVDAPLSLDRMMSLFPEQERPERKTVRAALLQIHAAYADRVAEVVEVASGWRIQVREAYGPKLAMLWDERPARFSRALLETLALIAYRQPITRGEIEEIRGVSVSPNILKTLVERDWVHVIGVREVPGRPELLGTTKQFLDDFCLKSLQALPNLPEIRDLDALAGALEKLTGEHIDLSDERPDEDAGEGLISKTPAVQVDEGQMPDMEAQSDPQEDTDGTSPDSRD